MSTLKHRDPNRTALFGSDHSHSPSPVPSYGAPSIPSYARGPSPNPYSHYGGMAGVGNSNAYSNHATAEGLESQNEEALDGLSEKVKRLKDITVSIGTEVRDSTKLMDSINNSFADATGLLSGTFKRMNVMGRNQGGRWWYWLLFLIIVFWIFVFRWLFH